MFLVFGHNRVWFLDRGLPRWCVSGDHVESNTRRDAFLKDIAAIEVTEKVFQGQTVYS